MRIPNLNALRSFEAAARHLNFRRAAEEMHVTQGAVAQQVRRLEADLGVALFVRLPRGLALTEEGKGLSSPISEAFRQIKDAADLVRTPVRRITLNTTPSFASKWLVGRLGRLSEAHPDIDLQIVASEGIADFRSGEPAVAVRQAAPPFDAGLRAEFLSSLDLLAVCSPALALSFDRVTEAADLKGTSLIQDGHAHWDQVVTDKASFKFMRFNQTALATEAAASGQGVALAPRMLVAEDISAGRLNVVWKPPVTSEAGFYLVWPETTAPDPAQTAVVNWILGEVRSNPE